MKPRRLQAAGLIAAGAVSGAILAGTYAANATDNGSSSSPSSQSSSGSTTTPGTPTQHGTGDGRGHGPGGAPGETALTGSQLASAKAVALKAVPGGTVVRAETDSGDAAYEVHMTKADGTEVTVKLDKSFTLVNVESGMGK